MANDNPTTPRTTVRISTPSGCAIEAWVNLPEGDGPYPAAVMAHGVGAVKAGGLQPFAERFRAEGFAAVVFDYPQWGGSDGEPRDELSVPRQLQDYSTVIDWTAAQPNIGSNRIVAWGTSFARQRPASRGMAPPLAPRRIERLSKVINLRLCRPGEHLVPEDQSQRQTPLPPPVRPGEAVRRPVPAGRQLALHEHWNANYTAAVEADLAWRSQREASQAQRGLRRCGRGAGSGRFPIAELSTGAEALACPARHWFGGCAAVAQQFQAGRRYCPSRGCQPEFKDAKYVEQCPALIFRGQPESR
jgi:hypothetical protein